MTYEVHSFGEISSLSTAPNFDDALALLFPALMNPASSGYIRCCETGEVLVSVEEGKTTYIEESILYKMIDDLFEFAFELISELTPEPCFNMPENYFG